MKLSSAISLKLGHRLKLSSAIGLNSATTMAETQQCQRLKLSNANG
jgi:hypothetical protein